MTYTGINDILKAFFTKLKSWLQTNITKSYVGLGNCDNTADKDKSVNSAQYVSRSNNTYGASSNTLVHFEGTTDAYTQSAELTNGDDLEIRNTLIDDISTKETWYGNTTKLMTLQPTGTWDTITGADLTLHNGTITANKFSGELEGNATTATKLATARSISISNGYTSNSVNFDGSDNISITVPNVMHYSGEITKADTDTFPASLWNESKIVTGDWTDWPGSIWKWGAGGSNSSFLIRVCGWGAGDEQVQFAYGIDNNRFGGSGWNTFASLNTEQTFSAVKHFTSAVDFSGTLVIPTTSSTTNGAIWIG